MPQTFLDLINGRQDQGALSGGASSSPAAQGVRPGSGDGTPHSWEFAFATGIECSNPTIVDAQGRRIRRDLLDECGHYQRFREDLRLVKDLGIPCLRYGLPSHRVHLGPDRFDW